MAIPANLESWTFDTVLEVVRTHDIEPAEFDYKEVLKPAKGAEQSKADLNTALRRTMASMANAGGGVVLFGVQDRAIVTPTPEARIVGISIADDLLKLLGDKLGGIVPEIALNQAPRIISLPGDPARCVFAVEIPLSPRRPHMVVSEGRYYRRGAGGSAEVMSHYEVRDQMLYTEERLQQVRLFRLELAQYREQIQVMEAKGAEPRGLLKSLVRFDTSTYKTVLASICGLFPATGNLLEELLRIPTLATLINEYLNRTTFYGLSIGGMVEDDISGEVEALKLLLELKPLCERCEDRLAELFGALTGSEPRASTN